MPNDIKLQEGHPVDSNLRPLKIGNDVSSLELSTTGARVNDLEIGGDLQIHGSESMAHLNSITTVGIQNRFMNGTDPSLAGYPDNAIEFNPEECQIKLYSTHSPAYDYSTFTCGQYGALEIATYHHLDATAHLTLAPDGDTIIDRNTALTATGTAKGLHIDYDHTGISASGQTVTGIGLDLDMNCESVTHVGAVTQIGIDLDMVAATDGVQINTGIDIKCTGGDKNHGLDITVPDGATDYHIRLFAADDTSDFANIVVADTGDLTIATSGSGTTDSDMTLDVDGDMNIDAAGGDINLTSADVKMDAAQKLYLDGGGDTYIHERSTDNVEIIVGGDRLMTFQEHGADGNAVAFPANTTACFVRYTGVFHATNSVVDFRYGNKAYLAVTGAITNLNLTFPEASGNFVLYLDYDGDHTITNYKVYEFDEGVATVGTVMWPGGTKPDNTASGNDIFSFYWDAEAQTAFGVASLAFAEP